MIYSTVSNIINIKPAQVNWNIINNKYYNCPSTLRHNVNICGKTLARDDDNTYY